MNVLLTRLTVIFFCLAFASCSSTRNVARTYYSPEDSLPALKPNSIIESKVTAISTNFTVPVVRFNRHIDPEISVDNSKGSVAFFNSVGAGIGIVKGRLREITDANSKVISTEMDNTIGFQLGVLFAANTEDANRQDIFAVTAELNFLNFQLGGGYEFGHVVPNQRRIFYTIAYGISVAKLTRGGFFILRNKNKSRPQSYFPN